MMMQLATRHKIRLAACLARMVIVSRKLTGKPPEAEFIRRKIRWLLDLREGIDFAIFLFGGFELFSQRAYKRIIQPGSVVFYVGANIGAHTLPMARMVCPQGVVHAFEATQFAVDKLRVNLALNPELRERVLVQHVLLTDGRDTLPETEIYSSWPLAGSTGNRHPQHKGMLKYVGTEARFSLDQYASQIGLERLDFIKLDVDGHEWPILQGMSGLLDRFHPAILFELAPDYSGVPAVRILEFLAKRNYQLTPVGNQRITVASPEQLISSIPEGGSINVLAR
jgi:FkbM family methyltransferase